MTERLPVDLLKPLADLWQWLDALHVQAVIVGGVAVSFLGRPRFTQDIDALAVLPEARWAAAVTLAAAHGIVPRIENPVEFAQRSRVLLLRHIQSSIDIDVILGGLPFEEKAVAQGRAYSVGGVTVRLPRVEDLLIMKAVAHRPRDLQDMEGLLELHPDADLQSVRQWVSEFAVATSMSDLLDDFDKVVARAKRQSPEE